MPDSNLDDLVSLWQQARDEGRSLSTEELCANRPELAAELARRIEVLRKLEAWGKARYADGQPTCPDAPPLPRTAAGPTWSGSDPMLPRLPSEAPPGYELLGVLGRGGMGIVYRARQKGLNRLVALKMILGGAQAGEEERLRFLAEAEVVAALHHEGIVQVYDFGTFQDVPWFALEFCEGGTLEQRLEGKPLPPRVAAALLRQLALAMQAAHLRGVIHRDLKPANVLLAQRSHVLPRKAHKDANGVLLPLDLEIWDSKITDFGLARRLDMTGMTRPGAIMGTPSYMPPEQARGDAVGAAADQYALGAIFYECLVGKPPFLGATPQETLVQVANMDPVPVRSLQPAVPRDLETICLKCLEKDPARRYGTCQELADDLGRFLAGEPIHARAVGPLGRAAKWVRRNPVVASLAVGLLVLAAAALVVISVLYADATRARDAARRERDSARDERNRAEVLLYASQLASAQREAERGNTFAALRQLDSCRWDLRGWEHRLLWTGLVGGQVTLEGHSAAVSSLALSPSGRFVLSGSLDRSMRLWDTRSGEPVAVWKDEPAPVRAVAVSRDGRLAISGDPDGTLRLRDIRSGRVTALSAHKGAISGLAVAPDGTWIASAGWDHVIQIRSLPSGTLLREIVAEDSQTCIAVSPDGESIAAGEEDGTVRVYDATTRSMRFEIKAGDRDIGSVAFSPDGKLLATGGAGRMVRLWDAVTGEAVRALAGHRDRVTGICFCPDGGRLASSSFDDSVRIWEVDSGKLLRKVESGGRGVGAVAWCPRGRRLLSGAEDGLVRIFDGCHQSGPPGTHEAEVSAVSWSPDGAWLASAGWDRKVRIMPRDGGAAQELEGHDGEVYAVAWGADGKSLYSGGADFTIRAWAMPTGDALYSLEGHTGAVAALALRAEGKVLASVSADGTVRLWDLDKRGPSRSIDAGDGELAAVAWSPDGKRLAVGGESKCVVLLDGTSGAVLARWKGHARAVSSLAWSPDGRWLASGSADQTVIVWNSRTGEAARMLEGHAQPVTHVAWSPDGTRLVSAGEDNHLALWDGATWQRLLSVSAHTLPARCAQFSPDGELLASCGFDRTVKVWDGRLAPVRLALQRHPVALAKLERLGGLLVGLDQAGQRVAWNSASGRLSDEGSNGPEVRASVSPDGEPEVADTARAKVNLARGRKRLAAWDTEDAGWHARWSLKGRGRAALWHQVRLLAGSRTDQAESGTLPEEIEQGALRLAALVTRAEDAPGLLRRAGEQAIRRNRAEDHRVRAMLLLKAGHLERAKASARFALCRRKADGPPLEELLLATCCKKLGDEAGAKAWLARVDGWQGEWCAEASFERQAMER